MKTLFFNIVIIISVSCFTTNGQTPKLWNCPDSKQFPSFDKKSWDKIPVVNGRLSTEKETRSEISITYYDKKKTPDAKAYNMTLPKLASYFNPWTKKDEIVVVIQIVQTSKDTIVGYRYFTGGCGGSIFRDFRFLTDNEVKKAVGQ